MDRLGEALTICKLMFTEDRPSFEGKHYRIEEALNRPRPIQAGGPPILIGGMGERRTLRFAAEFADLTHWFPASVEELQHKVEVLAEHCAAVGRDPVDDHPDDGLAGDPGRPRERGRRAPREDPPGAPRVTGDRHAGARAPSTCRTYIAAGFTGFTFGNTMLRTIESIGLAGEVLRLLA